MDVTAFAALLNELDTKDGSLAARLGPEVPLAAQRRRGVPQSARGRTVVHHFPDTAPTVRTWRLTGGHVACLVEGAGPAVRTLRILRRLAPRHAWAYLDGVRGLAHTIRGTLGADPTAWARLQSRLANFPGLLPELVADAARYAEAHAGPRARVPRPPRAIRIEMRQLLMLLDADTLAALTPHLDRRTVADLARFGAVLPPETLAWLATTATDLERLVLAKARWSRPDLAAALVALGDPDVNAALYLNPHTSVAVRARIMAQADRVPLRPSVIACIRAGASRPLRLPALWSGDPLLVRAALLRRDHAAPGECLRVWEQDGHDALAALFRGFGSESAPSPYRLPRYRSLLLAAVEAVWRRHGVDEARRLVRELAVPTRDAALFTRLFAQDEGLAELAAEREARTGTRVLLQRLRRTFPTRWWPLVENPDADWSLIARADRRRALAGPAWAQLAALPGGPDRVLPETGGTGDESAVAGAGRWPTGPEVHVPREWNGRGYTVAEPARRGRAMAPDYLFSGMAPATQALNTYGCLAELTANGPATLRYGDHLRALVDKHLGASTEARVVAMRMLDGFAGTTEELLETAGAMTLVSVK